jgi:hypothetical protein
MAEITNQSRSDISETYLAPVYWRAIESQRPDAMLRDDVAVALVTKTLRRHPMTDTRLFLTGLTAGAIVGLLAKRLAIRPRRMPYLDIGQHLLAETRGPVQAALLAARVQARYDELYAHRLRFDQPALR